MRSLFKIAFLLEFSNQIFVVLLLINRNESSRFLYYLWPIHSSSLSSRDCFLSNNVYLEACKVYLVEWKCAPENPVETFPPSMNLYDSFESVSIGPVSDLSLRRNLLCDMYGHDWVFSWVTINQSILVSIRCSLVFWKHYNHNGSKLFDRLIWVTKRRILAWAHLPRQSSKAQL